MSSQGNKSKRSEDSLQAEVFNRLNLWGTLYPELMELIQWVHAIPNGGLRDVNTANILSCTGVKKGVSDICVPFTAGPFTGMYVETKKVGGKAFKEQLDFKEAMEADKKLVRVSDDVNEIEQLVLLYIINNRKLTGRYHVVDVDPYVHPTFNVLTSVKISKY